MPEVAVSRNPLWGFQTATQQRKPEQRRQVQLRQSLDEVRVRERKIHEERQQILANQENTARRTLDEARASTAKRDKTLVEEVGEWGIEYRNAKEPIKRAIFEPGFASVQKEALNKQMLLPRRNTIQKDMPQWFQQDARNMPDWFQLRRELDNAEQLNLFQRSESGSLTRFKQASRSFSTEPYMDTVQVPQGGTPYQSRGMRSQNTANDIHVTADGASPSRPKGDHQGSLSPLGSSKDGLDSMTSLQLQKEMEKRDEEFLKIVAKQAQALSPTKSKGGDSPLKTLVSGSLMSPIDSALAAKSFDCRLPRQPPFAIETEFRDEVPDPKPFVCTSPANPDKSEQFAWWSAHWADITAPVEKSLEPVKRVKAKPIKPVDNFWKGNFQKRPVPWRKEQLGAFPSYKDFPWPPPERDELQKQHDKAIHRYLADNEPWGDDRLRFKGPSDPSVNKLVMPSDNTIRQFLDFMDKRSDLSNSLLAPPAGKAWRPRASLGWAGYKQSTSRTKDDQSYDPFSRRKFSTRVDKMLGELADKMVERGIIPSAGNFLLQFAHFEPQQPKTGFLNRSQFRVALEHFGAVFKEADEQHLFDSFAEPAADGELKVPYQPFTVQIEERGLFHPLAK